MNRSYTSWWDKPPIFDSDRRLSGLLTAMEGVSAGYAGVFAG